MDIEVVSRCVEAGAQPQLFNARHNTYDVDTDIRSVKLAGFPSLDTLE